MIRRPPRSTLSSSSAASDVYKRQQLALALEAPRAPALRPLGDWDALVADYATTGVTIAHHPLELLRAALARDGAVSSHDLQRLRHGAQVQLGGLVMARQKPETAKG